MDDVLKNFGDYQGRFGRDVQSSSSLTDIADAGGEYAHFDHFAETLQELLLRDSLVDGEVLEECTEVLKARTRGYDH